jgi:7,8-didemethyl-8-hydroxy-5-deazariboflavin synthase CofG subunit
MLQEPQFSFATGLRTLIAVAYNPIDMGGGTSIASASVAHSPIRDILDRALAGERLTEADAIALIECPEADLGDLLDAAAILRDRGKGRTVTYSRKVFLPVTNLCRDRCTYCTFRKDPGDPGAWTMMPDEVSAWSRRGAELGCKEALMCLGDKPEVAFKEYRATLSQLGVRSTIEYVGRACELAIDEGLLPHTNAGLMSPDEMAMLRPLNASMGLMLESISPRLRMSGGVHQWAPDKEPRLRIKMTEEAGALKIPFTSGILIGIGENIVERAQSLVAIRDIHERHGHIQEVIIQNFRAKPEIPMANAPEPDEIEMARTLATARLLFGEKMNVQAPPNLSPNQIELFLHAGINDWGGISPLSKDYVNPESPWPHLQRLAERCDRSGFRLRERLAIYPEYVSDEWLDPAIAPRVRAMAARVADSGGPP